MSSQLTVGICEFCRLNWTLLITASSRIKRLGIQNVVVDRIIEIFGVKGVLDKKMTKICSGVKNS